MISLAPPAATTETDVGEEDEAVQAEGRGVARWVRPALYGFLVVFLVVGLFSVEVWPLTGWRLYHERRGQERSSWQIVAVDAEGDEETIHLGALPLGWHNTSKIIGEFPSMSGSERDAVCGAWALPAREAGQSVEEVRVYRVRSTLRAEPSDRRRELEWTCGRR
jgi:hypothetical protein